jgi:thiol-disulfide isomerase/thioredoxin
MERRIFMQTAVAGLLMAGPVAAREPFRLHSAPLPLLSPPFQDDSGQRLTLADFTGRVILLNIWATWCPPCRTEMPALDALQTRLGSADFTVIALSVDGDGIAAASQFYQANDIRALGLYWGDDLRVQLALGIRGLPTSLLIDSTGAEISRVSGPEDWASEDALDQLSGLIAQVGAQR